MCGFFTSIGTINVDLKRSTDIIEHRGPDSDGYLDVLKELRCGKCS